MEGTLCTAALKRNSRAQKAPTVLQSGRLCALMMVGDQTRLLDLQQRAKTIVAGKRFKRRHTL
ncbi:hypothetical protein EFK07_19700 [Pseudomonas putida]|uniref:Uncharacterized protein n=1 Tax=Pseudomonas putida TaxID=303 RepID=A0A3M8T4W2_PSEPU|nr:hypothetical protein BC89_29605 [Pseudomonas monteilii]RNF86746.1 hypothetical protein EFK07_19700 [Pseudomonas putida]